MPPRIKTVTFKIYPADEYAALQAALPGGPPRYFGVAIPPEWVRGWVDEDSRDGATIILRENAPLSVAAHELGHVLGFQHTTFPGIMAFHPLRLTALHPRGPVKP